MKAIWTIAKREIYAFFVSPMAYVVLTAWVVCSGFSFYLLATYLAGEGMRMGASQDNVLTAFFGGTSLFYYLLIVIVPLFTMRLFAEEKQRGTLETLLTAPVSEVSVVLGKYLAAMVFWCALWAPSLIYVWLTSRYGDVDAGAISASYLGLFGIGLYYMAVGVFMSVIAPNQIIAAVLTFAVLAMLFLFGIGAIVFQDETREIFSYFSIWGHMEAFGHGIVDSRYLTFDISLAALCLTGAVGVLSLRRVEG